MYIYIYTQYTYNVLTCIDLHMYQYTQSHFMHRCTQEFTLLEADRASALRAQRPVAQSRQVEAFGQEKRGE